MFTRSTATYSLGNWNARNFCTKGFWCIILGINGPDEYNQQFHGFKAWMDPILKFVRSKIKQLAKQLQY